MFKVCSRSLSLDLRHLFHSCLWVSTKRSIMMILVLIYKLANSLGDSQPTEVIVSIGKKQNPTQKLRIKTMEQTKPITIFSSFSSFENKIASNKRPRRSKTKYKLPKWPKQPEQSGLMNWTPLLSGTNSSKRSEEEHSDLSSRPWTCRLPKTTAKTWTVRTLWPLRSCCTTGSTSKEKCRC